MYRATLCCFLLSLVNVLNAAEVVKAPAESGEMQSLFNGKDLSGWDGDPRLWSVKDGAIRGETTPENKANGNTLLTIFGKFNNEKFT